MKLYILISDIEKEFNDRLNFKKINYDIIHKQYLISNLTSNIKEESIVVPDFLKNTRK